MILVDANLLIYAFTPSYAQHPVAKTWLDTQLNGTARVGLPWPSLLAFLRMVSNPRLFEHPASLDVAWRQVSDWLACETAWVPTPGHGHADVRGTLLASSRVAANLVHDAHLAALAIEHGLTLCSADGDFARFTGLRWQNPLTASTE